MLSADWHAHTHRDAFRGTGLLASKQQATWAAAAQKQQQQQQLQEQQRKAAQPQLPPRNAVRALLS